MVNKTNSVISTSFWNLFHVESTPISSVTQHLSVHILFRPGYTHKMVLLEKEGKDAHHGCVTWVLDLSMEPMGHHRCRTHMHSIYCACGIIWVR